MKKTKRVGSFDRFMRRKADFIVNQPLTFVIIVVLDYYWYFRFDQETLFYHRVLLVLSTLTAVWIVMMKYKLNPIDHLNITNQKLKKYITIGEIYFFIIGVCAGLILLLEELRIQLINLVELLEAILLR